MRHQTFIVRTAFLRPDLRLIADLRLIGVDETPPCPGICPSFALFSLEDQELGESFLLLEAKLPGA